MKNNQEKFEYAIRRTKLSTLYEEIGKYLKEHGDADIRSIAFLNGDREASYKLELSDLNSFDTKPIGEIEVKYEDVQYTKEEWQSGVIDVSKVNNRECNLLEARSCCLREDNLCGKAKSCDFCPYMKNVSQLWKEFCDTPIAKQTGCIMEEWNNFPIGTFRSDIVDWFHNMYEVDIDALKIITGRDYNIVNR